MDHTNQWFASAGDDRVIKVWDLASAQLKLTLTGHIKCGPSLLPRPITPCGPDSNGDLRNFSAFHCFRNPLVFFYFFLK